MFTVESLNSAHLHGITITGCYWKCVAIVDIAIAKGVENSLSDNIVTRFIYLCCPFVLLAKF